MNSIFFRSLTTMAFSLASFSLFAAQVAAPSETQKMANAVSDEFSPAVLQASANAAKAWLGVVDSNRYAESWDKLASLAKLTINKDEWVHLLDTTRRPLGAVSSREIQDQRTAKDPSGMPKGDYIVMFYKTVFSHKTGFELVTLYLEDGKWQILTYQVDTSTSQK